MLRVLKPALLSLLIGLGSAELAFAIGTTGRGGGVGELLGSLVIIALISIVVFLILREFWCWYWKINAIVDLLRQINAKLGGYP